MVEEEEGLLTRQEVAKMLKVSLWTLNQWRRDGTLPALALTSHTIRYRREDVDRLLARAGEKGTA